MMEMLINGDTLMHDALCGWTRGSGAAHCIHKRRYTECSKKRGHDQKRRCPEKAWKVLRTTIVKGEDATVIHCVRLAISSYWWLLKSLSLDYSRLFCNFSQTIYPDA